MITLVSLLLSLHAPSTPGNVGFDPLKLAASDPLIGGASYRAAELKHGRLAMLASVAWPTQEALHPVISTATERPNLLALNGLSPSLVNGGLDPSTLIALVGLGAAIEIQGFRATPAGEAFDGDYGWRATKHASGTAAFRRLENGEVWNGRIAMLAMLGYVVQEAVTATPLISSL